MKLYKDTINDRYHAANSKEAAFVHFLDASEADRAFSWFSPPELKDIQEVDTPFNPKKKIATAACFEDYCEFLLEGWLCDLSIATHPHYCRAQEEGDPFDDGEVSFMYTVRGDDMVRRAMDRLSKLAEKHFPDEEIEIRTSYYREY